MNLSTVLGELLAASDDATASVEAARRKASSSERDWALVRNRTAIPLARTPAESSPRIRSATPAAP
mgnify:CR=1 FL=1